MESANLLKGLFKKLGNESNFAGGEGGGHLQLTPHLALVVSILYMMVADGEISDQETSQLQSVVGNNEAALKRALHYVATTKIEQFLSDAPSVLDSQDSLCVLMNVCDSIMADGQLAEIELDLFQRLTSALGHSKKSFRTYFNTISIKNKKSVLGSFENFTESDQLTPQLALAVSVLYMMSVDGSMAEEEIGQLNVVIGRSDSLLQAGLKYVRKNKFQKFVSEAAALLNTAQKLCILSNVCDSMMSDGVVADIEMDLFRRMLTAFNFSEEKFQPYFNILSRKNKKPEEKDDEDGAAALIPARIKKTEEEGFNFDRKISQDENKLKAPGAISSTSDQDDDLSDSAERSQLGTIINRKMQDNINRMSESIDGSNGMQDITDNANNVSENEEHALREHNNNKSLAPAMGAPIDSVHYLEKDKSKDSVHYLDNDANQDSIHYLDKEGAQNSVQYLEDQATSGSVHYLDKESGSGTANKDVHHPYKQAGPQPKHSPGRKIKSGPAKHRAIKDRRTLIQGKTGTGKDTSPSDLRVIEDSESGIDASPLEVRMTVVQTRTIEINQTLDKLDTVSASQFYKRGLILSTIKFSPAPTKTTTTALAHSTADKVSSRSIMVNDPISILQKEEFHVAANNSVLEKSESTISMQGMKIKIASLFIGLIIAHGFSTFGESNAQSDLIQKENLATNANISLQAVTTQQTLYKLAVDELDASLLKKESLGSEQLDIEKSKLTAYLKKIEDQESSPATSNGKKELAAARIAHEELAAIDTRMIQWFVLSKAILLFGIGLALCGFFFKSRFIFYGTSLTAILGTLLTLNGFFLFV